MKTNRNSDRLREILVSTRHQIVALKDIQIDLLCHDAKVANQVATQISALEEWKDLKLLPPCWPL